jgi:hypothetical protein
MVEHSTIITDVDLGKILIAYGQQLLSAPQLMSAPPAEPAKTEPDHQSKPPPKHRR